MTVTYTSIANDVNIRSEIQEIDDEQTSATSSFRIPRFQNCTEASKFSKKIFTLKKPNVCNIAYDN
jgi:hypothetical protein